MSRTYNNGRFTQFFDDSGTGAGNVDMTGNYSVAFALFGIVPEQRIRVHKLMYFAEFPSATPVRAATYGNLPALGRGSVLTIAIGLAPLLLLSDGFVTQNKGYERFAENLKFDTSFTDGKQWMSWERVFFPGPENALYVDPGDALWIFVNDDFSSFSKHRICMEAEFAD